MPGHERLGFLYVVENDDGSLETWNCNAELGLLGSITVIPAEPVVSRIHLNLKTPREVCVKFTAGPLTAQCMTGMQWLDSRRD